MASGYTFNDFIIRLMPLVITVLAVSAIFGRIVYRKWVNKKAKNVDEPMELNAAKYALAATNGILSYKT